MSTFTLAPELFVLSPSVSLLQQFYLFWFLRCTLKLNLSVSGQTQREHRLFISLTHSLTHSVTLCKVLGADWNV